MSELICLGSGSSGNCYLLKHDGKILILGSHPDHNTLMHGVEETAVPPYLLDRKGKVRYILRDADGRETERLSWQHDFDAGNGEHYIQRYSRILPLLSSDELHRGKVLDADCVLMRAAAVWKKGHDALERDPFYFVDRPWWMDLRWHSNSSSSKKPSGR